MSVNVCRLRSRRCEALRGAATRSRHRRSVRERGRVRVRTRSPAAARAQRDAPGASRPWSGAAGPPAPPPRPPARSTGSPLRPCQVHACAPGRSPWGAWRGSQPDWWPSLCKHDPFLGTAAEERAEVSVTATHVTRDFPGPSFPLINAACPRPNRNFLWCFLKILKLNTLTTINFLFHVTSRFYC